MTSTAIWPPALLVRDRYDDGGFSGGTLERPALKRLLTDIEAGLIDVIVVYKIDRLSRSLMDFAKLVEAMEAHGVTFLSGTQSFNTTTSMGRLTLNILLSLAQFEREVTPADLSGTDGWEITASQRLLSKAGLESCAATLAPPGSIVVSTRAPIGSIGIAVVPLCTNQGCRALVPRPGADTRFFAYALTAFSPHLNLHGRGTTFLELSADALGGFAISAPPPAEQRVIAAFLDRECGKIDALVVEQERLIALLKEKRQAVISHAVTKGLDPSAPMKDSGVTWLGQVPAHWRVGKCGFHLSILAGFAFPSAGFSDDPAHVRLLRGINVGVSQTRWHETVYWAREPGDGLERYALHAGDLVIGMDRPWVSEGVPPDA